MEDQALDFTFSWLLLLPVIAGILTLQGTWLDDGKSAKGRPKRYQRRLTAKILIHRTLIVNLLLATFFVYTSSLTFLPDVAQGVLLTVILMLPVFAYLLIVVFKWPGNKKTLPAKSGTSSTDLEQSKLKPVLQAQNALSETNALAETNALVEDSSLAEVNVLAGDTALTESAKALSEPDQQTLSATNHNELTESIASLQNEKIKLQKLIVAQKAVINAEKRRFQKAQALSKNALVVMHRARERAQVAIRVAKNERHERLRLKADNSKLCRQLENVQTPRQIKESVNY